MSFRGFVSANRRLHLLLPIDLADELHQVGKQHGVGLGAAIRLLVRRALNAGGGHELCRDCPAGLAALVAAEQTLLVVAAILPNGRTLVDGLAVEAAAAAERRLALSADASEAVG